MMWLFSVFASVVSIIVLVREYRTQQMLKEVIDRLEQADKAIGHWQAWEEDVT